VHRALSYRQLNVRGCIAQQNGISSSPMNQGCERTTVRIIKYTKNKRDQRQNDGIRWVKLPK